MDQSKIVVHKVTVKGGDVENLLYELGFGPQIEMSKFINTIDDQFGEGSANKKEEGKSWGDLTDDNWENDPKLRFISRGNKEQILQAYIEMRRSGVRGWLGITTNDYQSFSMWQGNTQ